VRRLLGDMQPDCAAQGFVLFPDAMQAVAEGDYEKAREILERVAAIGDRFGDPDLVALSRHGLGRVLIRAGKVKEGLALLDEAMVAVTAGEVSPLVAGDVYCGVISGCHEIFDWRRAREWTAALTRWCAAQPELVSYRGQCLLRRAELLQLRGEWAEAVAEARRACERLSEPTPQPGLGAAWYQRGELHRVRGAFDGAEQAYRGGPTIAGDPAVGLALLRLAATVQQSPRTLGLPEANQAATEYLDKLGIRPDRYVTRMWLGTPPRWRADMIFGAFNFGVA